MVQLAMREKLVPTGRNMFIHDEHLVSFFSNIKIMNKNLMCKFFNDMNRQYHGTVLCLHIFKIDLINNNQNAFCNSAV